MAAFDRVRIFYRRIQRNSLVAVFRSPVYPLSLYRPTPKELRFTPKPTVAGDIARGEGILIGQFNFGEIGEFTSIDPWVTDYSNSGVANSLHTFGWLKDVDAIANVDMAKRRIRSLVNDWMLHNSKWSAPAWEGPVLATRIANWLEYYDQYFAKSSRALRTRLLSQIVIQLVHLNRLFKFELESTEKFIALKALIYGAICLPSKKKKLCYFIRKLESEIEQQILLDGGHFSRSPSEQKVILQILIDIRRVFIESQNPIPDSLQLAIDRMSSMLRFFRHLDGRLALFNGSREEDAKSIDSTLIQADTRGQPPRSAPDSGFERLLSGRLLILADTGAPARPFRGGGAHAGTLSIEVSVGQERMIVNCGSAIESEATWQMAQRMTAAHSTLSVEDRNSSEILNDGGLGRSAKITTYSRRDTETELCFEATHDGYRPVFDLEHSRKVEVLRNEEGVRGSEIISTSGEFSFAVRFHLHPTVAVSLAQGGSSALIKLKKGGGWRLSASGADMQIEDSIYLGSGKPKRTSQIVLTGFTNKGSVVVEWSIIPMS
jgi:uncharacterized heparinase superfamily protein